MVNIIIYFKNQLPYVMKIYFLGFVFYELTGIFHVNIFCILLLKMCFLTQNLKIYLFDK